jgi:hypothetical protein
LQIQVYAGMTMENRYLNRTLLSGYIASLRLDRQAGAKPMRSGAVKKDDE